MRQLTSADAGLADADLAELYAYPAGRWLRANFVTSADGAATLDGVSAGLSSPADRRVFGLLRALADVVVVGAATARTEGYGPVRIREQWRYLREGRTPTPPIALVSSRLEIDPASPLLSGAPADARTIVITTADAPPDRRAELARYADIIVAGETTVALKAALGALAERRHQRVLAEGGAHMLAQFVSDGLLDELCLTIAPLLVGPAAGRIVAGALSPSEPLRLALAHVIEDDGFLFCRYIRSA
jgi:riboflavin biosynthesis pyrimidine reductase